MRLLAVLCDTSRGREVIDLLESHGINAYTQIPMIFGSGATGKRMETRAWPGSGCMVFAIMDQAKVDHVLPVLRDYKQRLLKAEGFMVFSIEAEVHL
jgi:hypothetical protein